MINPHDHAFDLDINLLLHLHLLTLPRDITIESYTKKEEEIVAHHLKEESINPSLDQDLDQDTDRLHTIDKGVKEGIRDRQDPQGNIDVQHHCHIHYLQEAIYIPKQDRQGNIDVQHHCHVHYLQEGIYVPKQDRQGNIDVQCHRHVHYL